MTQDLQLDIALEGMEDVIADVDEFPQSVGRELSVAMEKSLDLLKGQVKVRTPVNTGKLADAINHGITSQFPNLVGFVGAPPGVPYAIVIEKGRKPGTMPPVDAIALWAVRKLGLSPEEAESAAWGIAKNIQKRGFSPKFKVGPTGAKMFEKGLEASEPHINQLFNNAIARSVARFNQS